MESNLCFPCTQECRPIPWKLVDLLWDPLEGNWLLPSSLWYLVPAQPAVESHNALLHICWSTDWTDLVWDCTGNHSCCDLMQSHCLIQADVSWNDQVSKPLGYDPGYGITTMITGKMHGTDQTRILNFSQKSDFLRTNFGYKFVVNHHDFIKIKFNKQKIFLITQNLDRNDDS